MYICFNSGFDDTRDGLLCREPGGDQGGRRVQEQQFNYYYLKEDVASQENVYFLYGSRLQ